MAKVSFSKKQTALAAIGVAVAVAGIVLLVKKSAENQKKLNAGQVNK